MKLRRLALFACLVLLGLPPAALGQRLQPEDLTYQGAFRLPDTFNWGARGLSFYPTGEGDGSLLVTGFELPSSPEHPGEACWDPSWDCYAYYGQVAIPDPAIDPNWENLPEATLLGGMINFDNGLVAALDPVNTYISDIQYLPRSGGQTADKIYGAIQPWYAEGVFGEDTFPTIWMANMDGSGVRGMFHVGPEETPYHGRKMGSYLFTVPQWYADRYLGGRILVTGRSRGTPVGCDPVTIQGGSQGPTLFAFRALTTDNPSGNLDALPILYYRVKFPGCAGPNVGDPAQCDYPDFTMCDSWTGGAFVDNGARRAIMLLGWKGLGPNCYDMPEPDPVVCYDPCNNSHGYHCYPYERQVIFYDVDALGANVMSPEPWNVLPYRIWRPEVFYIQGYACWNMGGMTFDPTTGRLFMVERGLGEGEMNIAVVHVWKVDIDPTTYDLTLSVLPVGSGTTTPSVGTHQVTSPQAISAHPAGGYRFVNWTATENITVADANAASTTVTLTGSGAVTANFTSALAVDIQANGSDSPVTVGPGDPVSIRISLDPAGHAGETADWWVGSHTPFAAPGNWYTFVYPTGWQNGIHLCAQTGLFPLSSFEVLNTPLPLGNYTFYFGIDDPDGQLAGPWLGLDSVAVHVQ